MTLTVHSHDNRYTTGAATLARLRSRWSKSTWRHIGGRTALTLLPCGSRMLWPKEVGRRTLLRTWRYVLSLIAARPHHPLVQEALCHLILRGVLRQHPCHAFRLTRFYSNQRLPVEHCRPTIISSSWRIISRRPKAHCLPLLTRSAMTCTMRSIPSAH